MLARARGGQGLGWALCKVESGVFTGGPERGCSRVRAGALAAVDGQGRQVERAGYGPGDERPGSGHGSAVAEKTHQPLPWRLLHVSALWPHAPVRFVAHVLLQKTSWEPCLPLVGFCEGPRSCGLNVISVRPLHRSPWAPRRLRPPVVGS